MSPSTNAHTVSTVMFGVLDSSLGAIVPCVILDKPLSDVLSALEFTSVKTEI